MPVPKEGKSCKDFIPAILCGLFGSLAGLCAKLGFTPTNSIYSFFDTMDYGIYIVWVLRIFFVLNIVISNIKMIELKIRSFAVIGSSLTVVIAFLANYAFNLSYEIIFYQKYPRVTQYIGSILMLCGIFVLKDQIVPNERPSSKKPNEDENEDVNVHDNKEKNTNNSERTLLLQSEGARIYTKNNLSDKEGHENCKEENKNHIDVMQDNKKMSITSAKTENPVNKDIKKIH